jgi:hypothetical protein
MSAERRLVIITGQEGAGKTTIVPALLPSVQPGAAFDAEAVGQVTPWQWDRAFTALLWDNVAALVGNFWQAGYRTVIVGSFVNDYADYVEFRPRLDAAVDISLVQLCASQTVRDQRRVARPKTSSKEWRDDVDRRYPEDTTLGAAAADYRHVWVATSALSVARTVAQIRRALPEVCRLG